MSAISELVSKETRSLWTPSNVLLEFTQLFNQIGAHGVKSTQKTPIKALNGQEHPHLA